MFVSFDILCECQCWMSRYTLLPPNVTEDVDDDAGAECVFASGNLFRVKEIITCHGNMEYSCDN